VKTTVMQAYIYDMLKQQNLVLRYKWIMKLIYVSITLSCSAKHVESALEMCDIHFGQYHAQVKRA
jgi:hypothetical protein